MADSAKQNKDSQSGQIFTGNQTANDQSAYSQAVFSPNEEVQTPQYDPQPEAPPPVENPENNYMDQGTPPPSDNFSPPPVYVEDPRRKFLVIALILIVFLAGGFFLLRFLTSKRNPPKTSSVPKEKITLTYWGLWEEDKILQPIFDDYKKQNENIEIKYLRQDPKDYRERLSAAIDRDEGPDILRFHNNWVPMMVKNLAPLPKDILSDDEFKKTFYPVASKDLLLGGNYYGLPLEIDGLMLFYNQNILEGAGVDVPKTWVDVQNTLPKLTVKDGENIVTSAIALGTAENVEHFSDILSLMMIQNGTDLTKSLFTCIDPKSTDCAIQTFQFYRKFAAIPNNTWDDTLENSILAFAGGKVAMIFAPSWEALVINQINPDLKFKTAKIPQLPCNVNPCPEIHWASYWVDGVSSKSKRQKESWQFLKYLTSKDVQQKLYAEQTKVRKLFGEPYSRVDLADSLKDNEFLAPLIAMAPNMHSFYTSSRTNDGETGLNSSLINYLKDAVNGLKEHGASEETVLKTADLGFQEVFKRFNITPAQ